MVPTDTDSKPHRCFVVIGFGVKTDLATGRAIDLDATYAELIKPALDAAGVDGFRAIDINRTGTIDSIMYKWLIEAELVVADISTLNANVLYELGVRHALKPRTTILMAESQLLKTLPFDLSHTIIHSYQLDGEHLREEEKPRFRAHLTRLLKAAIEDPPHLDSPVYDSLRGMEEPRWRSPEDLEAELTAAREEARKAREEPSDAGSWKGLPLVALIELAGKASGEKRFDNAVSLYRLALERNPKDPFLRQQLASALVQQADTQSNASDALRTLRQAEEVLLLSVPSSSTDPRILRVAGEINRRLHEKTHDEQFLEKAGWQFTRAFYIKQDHTHGIEGVKAFAKMAVQKKRPGGRHPAVHRVFMLCADLAAVCLTLIDRPGFTSRTDRESARHSLALAYLGMGKENEARKLIPAMATASGGGLNWATFVAENPEIAAVGRMHRQVNWVPAFWGTAAAAALTMAVLVPHYWKPVYWVGGTIAPSRADVTPPTCPSLAQDCRAVFAPLIEEVKQNGERCGSLAGPLSEVRERLVRIENSAAGPNERDRDRRDVLAGPLAEIRERLARIENSAAGFYELAGRQASLWEARHTAIKDILERGSKVAAGCAERTPALLRLLNVLVEQSNRIENKLEGVSRTSGGPHIQFDALRPGLAPGFTYPLREGGNPIEELGLHLTLDTSKREGQQLAATDTRTGRRTILVPEDSNIVGSQRQVRFRGFRLGNYCSLLTLSRDTGAPGWSAVIRLLDGCGESCERGCKVDSARTLR